MLVRLTDLLGCLVSRGAYRRTELSVVKVVVGRRKRGKAAVSCTAVLCVRESLCWR